MVTRKYLNFFLEDAFCYNNTMNTNENKIWQDYPTPIAQSYRCFLDSVEIKEQVNYACVCIETAIQHLGSLAVAIYRYSAPGCEYLNHAIFLSLERPFLGNWLRLMGEIGAYFTYQNQLNEVFSPLVNFWHDSPDDGQINQLIRFRNDARHGSVSLNPILFAETAHELQSFLARLAFMTEFAIQALADSKLYIFRGLEAQVQAVNEEYGSRIWLHTQSTQQRIPLEPLFFIEQARLHYRTPDHDSWGPKKYYRSMGWESEYDLFVVQKEGFDDKTSQTRPFFYNLEIIDDIRRLLNGAYGKVLILGEPGAGKTSLLQNLANMSPAGALCFLPYFIARSPLKISPVVAMKTFGHMLAARLASPLDFPSRQKEKIETWIQFINSLAQVCPQTRLVLAVDGLFSPHAPYLSSVNRKIWYYLLNAQAAPNIIWLVTGTSGTQIPHFYDYVHHLTPLPFKDVNPDIDKQIFEEWRLGNPRILNTYMEAGTWPQEGKIPDKLRCYFRKLLRDLGIKLDWQKQILQILAHSQIRLTPKELAARVCIFTPKVEKFLDRITAVARKEQEGYIIYHPVLASYLKEGINP